MAITKFPNTENDEDSWENAAVPAYTRGNLTERDARIAEYIEGLKDGMRLAIQTLAREIKNGD